ncbi:S8 family serine peptidase [Paraburkholderia youngii]|uniref:S8 family serine peptidase n=1 Tax=Paraburkholderia youngii TaxID=2782701 RepID=UPI003D191570
MTAEFLDRLGDTLAGKIERFTLAMPVLAGAPARNDVVATTDHGQLASASSTSNIGNVVVGICDDGIAFAHQNFLYVNETGQHSRVRCFWNQDDPANSAAGLGYGREILETEMQGLVSGARHRGSIDEEALYRDAGNTSVARRWTHGTATLDLAAGVNPRPPVLSPPGGPAPLPPVRALIAVQFRQPGRTVRDTSGLWLDAQALDAFRYIVARTQAIAGAKGRAFINMSYGYFAGPHDGSSMLEGAMDELSETGACSIVLPAGNSNLDRCHAKLTIAGGAMEALRWRVVPECVTPSFVEIWLPDSGDSEVSLQLVSPLGVEGPSIASGQVGTWTQNGERLCTVVHRGRGARGNGPMILIALAPTMTRDPNRRAAPNGDWMIRLQNKRTEAVDIHAWVQRNDTPNGFPPRGRQSRFDDKNYVRFDRYTALQDYDDLHPLSWIRREGTLSSIATGEQTCVVGGYRREDLATAPYSSTGFGRQSQPPYRAGPDVAAVADRSIVRKGVLAAGTRSGAAIPFEGTSAAAPQVLRTNAVPPGPYPSFFVVAGPIRDSSRIQAQAQTFPGGLAPGDRPLDPDEQRRRNAESSVGAGNVPSNRTAIEDG